MPERRKLTDEEIAGALEELDGWDLLDRKLHKQFKFGTFAEAMGWMTSVAIYADKIDHHPEWSNVYNRVTVDLITHNFYTLSNLDVALAKHMDQMFNPVRS